MIDEAYQRVETKIKNEARMIEEESQREATSIKDEKQKLYSQTAKYTIKGHVKNTTDEPDEYGIRIKVIEANIKPYKNVRGFISYYPYVKFEIGNNYTYGTKLKINSVEIVYSYTIDSENAHGPAFKRDEPLFVDEKNINKIISTSSNVKFTSKSRYGFNRLHPFEILKVYINIRVNTDKGIKESEETVIRKEF